MARARIRAGMPLSVLAEKLGVNKGNVSRWEQGRLVPSEEHIFAMAEILGDWGFVKGNPKHGIDTRVKGGWAKRGPRGKKEPTV